MALTDLIAQKAKFTEEVIEAIVSPYVRYDIDELEILLTPKMAELTNKQKILVYQVAMQGWQFVHDEAIDAEQTPKQLSESLGIPGPTLRPILKDLKDRNLLSARSSKYSVRSASLEAVRAEIEGSSTQRVRKRPTSKKRESSKSKQAEDNHAKETVAKANGAAKANSRRTGTIAYGTGESINRLIKNGFFNDGKTSIDVQERLHEQAIMVKSSSLPSYLLHLVRENRLTRKKEIVDGKSLWVYRAAIPGKL